MPAPVAFMVMPFDVKPTGITDPAVPAQVDFDALWDRVYMPVLKAAGYRPIRADQDIGGLIIVEMIQRLTVADLVLADITLSNANVYYEIGIRHAAREIGCVLGSASWSKPVFDLDQVRQLRYPLDDGAIGPSTAKAAKTAIKRGLDRLTNTTSPVFQSVPGFPNDVDVSKLSAFADFVGELSAFHAEAAAVENVPVAERRSRVEAIVDRYGHDKVVRETVVMRIIRLLRDNVGWEQVAAYIAKLPEHIANMPSVVEQRCLAQAGSGDAADAAASLVELIRTVGVTSERCGLLGGRYKQLYRAATTATDQRRFLQLAIEAYEKGMQADLNDYYPTSNLSRLYRARGDDGDEQRATDADVVTIAACERAKQLGRGDEWIRPTLLGKAFDRGDIAAVERYATEVEREGPSRWKLETTLADLRVSAKQHNDPVVRARLETVIERMAIAMAEA